MMEKTIGQSNNVRRPYRSVETTGTAGIFHKCCRLFLVAFFILPDAFGFRLGFLFSAKRIMMFICYGLIIFNPNRLNGFIRTMKRNKTVNLVVALYMFVRLYTAVYRFDINTFAGEFLDGVMVFYLFLYILKYEIKIAELLKFIRITLYILCVLSFIEYFTGFNVFSLLNFAKGDLVVGGNARLDSNRVSGPCHHAIHFGIYITFLFVLSCYNEEKNKIYLFNKPVLFVFSTLSVLFAGSRGPFGLYVILILILPLFSKKDDLIKSYMIIACILIVLSFFTLVFYDTDFGQYIMRMITSSIDGIFGTELSIKFGGARFNDSTLYREALKQVFKIDYFNKLVGRGVSYNLSVVIDGYWLQSCDNSYIMTYITLAYPGLIVLILFMLTLFIVSIKGYLKYKDRLFVATVIILVNYLINVWFVAFMGTFMYIWMLLALICILYNGYKDKEKKELTAQWKTKS